MSEDFKNPVFRLKILGARGSMPVNGKEYIKYGGATSCYKIRVDDEEIYLDAGSGILKANPEAHTHITILLTHMHLDHIIGLPFFVALTQKNRSIDIYSRNRSGLSAREAMNRIISPPYWPLKIENYPANVKYHEIDINSNNLKIGNVNIDIMEGTHPEGSTIYRLNYKGKSLVYATDFEHMPNGCDDLIRFASDCDLLLYDAQYKSEEYDKYKGYGHSTPEVGLEVAKEANAKRLLLVHHSPGRSDEELAEMESNLTLNNKNVQFAKVGVEIFI
ncbi:MAG: MBL fold metallo-hydrolase [Selenomonadaceae bacterium]|nr:MBL fold metallo-hydrolase [Selenomonadaceae bacterium]